ncbi:hypothetical protein BO99DRAFT_169174 [Aspergillus violaceofuscus CBS 115571]|uniref:Uncharacterized protein n=1 Tax=Aspergillus violaceofuscus (strain CBS 115571) TaxID=1450538 RepID=A0A2V5H365_ASPV1|nr:hypothetical protein BO99DRAFT_169174 [Aspergillus violaceofuscus CBS 115571]
MAPALRMTRSIKEKLPVFFCMFLRPLFEVGVSCPGGEREDGGGSNRVVGFILLSFWRYFDEFGEALHSTHISLHATNG